MFRSQLATFEMCLQGGYLTKLMVGVMVLLVVLVLVVVSSQLSKCAYRGGVFDKADGGGDGGAGGVGAGGG